MLSVTIRYSPLFCYSNSAHQNGGNMMCNPYLQTEHDMPLVVVLVPLIPAKRDLGAIDYATSLPSTDRSAQSVVSALLRI